MKKTVLIIDDNKGYVEALREVLKKEYCVKGVPDGRSGIKTIDNMTPDVVIIDLNLPDMSGFEVLRLLRENSKTFDIPIIMLTVNKDGELVARSLKGGADKYITKSASVEEINAHIKSILRRVDYDAAEKEIFSSGNMLVDANKNEVLIEGKKIHLTKNEFGILIHLLKNRRRIIVPQELYRRVWNYKQTPSNTKTLEVHIYRLRKKLATCGIHKIKNVSGKGYLFE